MAGRIPQAFLDDLLDRVDIVEVVDRRVKLRKTGKNYSARCPFHDEKTPSFSVSPDKQFFYCFGCGASGNALGFVMDYENIDFPQAVENLAGSVGLTIPRETNDAAQQARDEGSRALYKVLEQAADYYRRQLRQHSQCGRAVDYLKGRGLTGQVAKQFDLGFAPPGWDNLMKALGTDDAKKKLLQQAGLLVKNDAGRIYDRFRDRVVFPIRDMRGRIIAFGGRVLGDDKPKYLNSPETPVFHKGRELYGLYQARKASRKLESVIVVEGYMDVIALAQHGVDNATATLGTATSQAHLERIYRLCAEVVFCFDGDEAGRKAAARAMEAALPCMEDGCQARFLFLPEGEDPDTVVRSGGAEHFQQLLAGAVPLESFLFDQVAEGIDISSMDGRARLSKRALPLIRQLPEGVYRELMMRALAERTGLELTSLQRLQTPPTSSEPPPPAASENEPPPQFDPNEPPPDPEHERAEHHPRQRQPLANAPRGFSNLAQAAIALLLHQPDMARLVSSSSLSDSQGDDVKLLQQLVTLLKKQPESSTAMLLGHWYGTSEGELLGQLAGQERLIPSEGVEQQFLDTIAMLAQRPLLSQLRAELDKLKLTNYPDLSAEEKRRLPELIVEIQRIEQQRSAP